MSMPFIMTAQNDDVYTFKSNDNFEKSKKSKKTESSDLVSVKSKLFTVKQGDPLVLLQEKKSATFEIDYSQMMVTDGKDHEDDIDFRSWMILQDEDNDKWLADWERKDSVECNKAFRENFNDEIKKGIKLSKIGKNYKVILRLNMINFGKTVNVAKTILVGFSGGSAIASGELEVRNINDDSIVLILAFKDLKGEDSMKQIGRLKGIFENLSEELNDYLEDYKKEYEKQQKKLKKKK